jgi:hypothetical protein
MGPVGLVVKNGWNRPMDLVCRINTRAEVAALCEKTEVFLIGTVLLQEDIGQIEDLLELIKLNLIALGLTLGVLVGGIIVIALIGVLPAAVQFLAVGVGTKWLLSMQLDAVFRQTWLRRHPCFRM